MIRLHALPAPRTSLPESAFPRTLGRLALLVLLSAARAAFGQEAECAACHEVDAERFAASVHGFLACTDCHLGADQDPHAETVSAPTCEECHAEAVAELSASAHGEVGEGGRGWIEGCVACHGDPHRVAAGDDPASAVHPANLPTTCGGCHADPEMAGRFALRRVQPVAAYEASVHAREVAAGRDGATCSSCHGSHSILPGADPRSAVNRSRVPATCGACHGEIAATYAASIHGQAAAKGVREAPVCTDCHGEHRIISPREAGSPVFATNIPKQTCGTCHGDLRLAEKFGLDPGKVPAYEDSFHGLASRAGALSVAHCGSCHGIHDILPSSDPRSHVAPSNLPATCGQCHPGAGATFALGPVHVLPTAREHAAVWWIRTLYLWLIALTIGGMVGHNVLDLWRKARTPSLRPAPGPAAPRERLSLGFRVAHGGLAVSFIVLAWSGFALQAPDAWWARPLTAWEASLGLRGLVHRVAAVVLLLAAAFHLGHLVFDRRARRCLARMRLGLGDWHEIKERLAWYFGRRAEPPPSPWVGYAEKAEYLAVVWGTGVMAATGFLLWFENLTLAWLPKWAADVATVIHLYEAILACLAILVWHFYWVIFDPLVYPMDPAWLTGRSAPARDAEREGPGR